jgi:membrane-associated phospholipid phosphatase
MDMSAYGITKQTWLFPPVLFLLGIPLWMHWVEPAAFLALNGLGAPVLVTVWTGLSLLGNGWGVLGVTAPLLVLAPRLMWGWLCAAPFAIAFARTGKFFIESPRPAAVIDNKQMRIVGEVLSNVSMPSGHTTTAFAVASGIYFAIPVARRKRHRWLFALAAATGLSRIAVGAHWPGDVAVGASLGMLAGMLGHALWQRIPTTWTESTSLASRVIAVLLVLAGYHLLAEELDFAENQPWQILLALVVGASLLAFVRQNYKK